MAHWLIQRGFDSDKQYLKLIESIERMNIPHSFCTVIPFSDSDDGIKLESPVPEDGNIYCYGSYSLSKHAVRRGYFPGAFISDNSSIDNLIKHYGKNMLNYDSVVVDFGCPDELIPDIPLFFIKPNEDTKAFTAEVLSRDAFFVFKNKILQIGDEYSTVTRNTRVVIASPKEISAEYRFFVVDGKVITQSLYKSGGTVYYSSHVDEYIIEFAQKMVDTYQPDRAFVLDVAITPEGLKVIEVNSINSSGLYAIDVQKMIFAIEEMLP